MNEFYCFDNVFEPVLIEDRFGKIVYFNSALLSFFQVTPRFLKKQDDGELFFKNVIPNFYPLYLNLKETNTEILSSEIEITIDEKIATAIVKGVYQNEHFIYFIKDMTVEKQLYDKYKIQMDELKITHSQILQSDKLKVIGEMTANISHEINNPLTVAMGNSEMISFCLDNPDINKQKTELLKFNDNIFQSISRITNIISNMKDFLHKSEDDKEYYSAKDIIEKSITFLSPMLTQNKIKCSLKISEVNPIVLINKIKIEQVFVNLIQNAIDALVEFKTINPEIIITIYPSKVDGYISIDIKDNGPGVSNVNKDKIFNTFFTTKSVGKGTGLGLSITSRIIESHQGKISLIDSNTGALFQIILPSVSVSSYINGDWEKMHSSNLNFKKVLVVDDEPSILNLCLSFLKNSDFYFLGATSVEEALIQIKRIKVDLIITDFKMPLKNGEEFVRELRKNNINIPVYFMTSKEALETFKSVKDELSLSGMIIKPFTKEELIKTIEAALYVKN